MPEELKPPVEIKPGQGGLYEVWREGQRVATGTKQYAEQVASGQAVTPAKPVSTLSSDRGNKIISDALADTNRPITPPEAKPKVEPPKTTEDKLLESEFESTKTEAQKLQDELKIRYDKQESDLQATLDPIKAQLERNKQGQIDTIKSQYAVLRSQLEESNRRRQAAATTLGYRRGGQFAPTMMSAQVEGVVQQGVARLNELNSQEANAVAAVNNAYDEKSLSLALEEYNKLTSIRKERDKALDELNVKLAEANKKVTEENTKLANQSLIYNAVTETGSSDVVGIFSKLGGKVSTDEIKNFLDDITPKESKDTTSNAYKFKTEDVGKLISLGMTGEEIQITQDIFNKFGLYNPIPEYVNKSLAEILSKEELAEIKDILYPITKVKGVKGIDAGLEGTSFDLAQGIRVARLAFGGGRSLSDKDRDFGVALYNAGKAEGKNVYQHLRS